MSSFKGMGNRGALYLGVDLGASATKAVVIDAGCLVLGKAVVATGMDFATAGGKSAALALAEAGYRLGDIRFTVATGYGRKNLDFAGAARTEISCHGRGAYHYFPEAITVVDIGGEDNKIIKIGADGRRLDFLMNRKCAAGTGAFLEEIARRLDVPMGELEALARQSSVEVEIGSFCTVFSAAEVLVKMRRGVKVPDIVKAALRSVVRRITEMEVLSGRIVATGGVVAHLPTIVELLGAATGVQILTPPEPQLAGAMGAALFALEESTDA